MTRTVAPTGRVLSHSDRRPTARTFDQPTVHGGLSLTTDAGGLQKGELRPYGPYGESPSASNGMPDNQPGVIDQPVSISDGVPAAGAGNLETKASRDIYTFTVPAGGQAVYVDWLSGLSGSQYADWKVINDATGSVVHATTVAIDKQLTLPAGAYRLEVASAGERTGAYRVNIAAS